jgi:O-antigen/teichoic acid export membrane protein
VSSPATVAPAGASGVVRRARITRLGWTTADQLVSSATNAALSFLVAREVAAAEFGAFAFAFVAFSYGIGVLRSLVSEPLIVRFSGADPARLRQATAASAGSAVLVGAVAGVLAASVGLLLGGLTGTLLMILAVLLPGLLLQDFWRLAFFAAGRPRSAFVNDTVWAVLQIGAVVALIRAGRGDTVSYLTAWGLSAVVAAGLGAAQAGTLPRLGSSVSFIREHRDIGARFTWGFLINQGAFNTVFVIVGGIAGVAAVAAMRAAQVLLGPMRVIMDALSAFALPLLSRRTARGQGVARPAVIVSLAAGSLTAAWTGALLLIPTRVGEALLGDTWVLARDVIGVFGLSLAAIGLSTGGALALKALSEAGLLLRVTLVQAPLALGLGAFGAAWNGAVGAVAGLLVTQAVGAAYVWSLAVRRMRREAPR